MCLNKWRNHDPENMRTFTPPETDKPRPGILEAARKKLEEYLTNPKVLPSLNNANGSPRQQRTERRESTVLLMSVMLYHMDLRTMRCGVLHPDGRFEGIRLKDYAAAVDLSLSRAEEACPDLVDAGIVRTYEAAERRPDGSIKGLAAIRTISVSFFHALGLTFRLGFERKRAYKKERQEDIGRRELAMEAAKIAAERKAGKPIREPRTIIGLLTGKGKRKPYKPMDQATFEAKKAKAIADLTAWAAENATGPPLPDGDPVPA